MKRKYVISLIIIAVAIGLFIFYKDRITGEELEISFVKAQKRTPKDLAYDGILNNHEWLMIRGDDHRESLEEIGYIIPRIDFSKNHLIISRYRISKLYREAGYNECLGVPDGKAFFDKKNSSKDSCYFYLMPLILLSQGVG